MLDYLNQQQWVGDHSEEWFRGRGLRLSRRRPAGGLRRPSPPSLTSTTYPERRL